MRDCQEIELDESSNPYIATGITAESRLKTCLPSDF